MGWMRRDSRTRSERTNTRSASEVDPPRRITTQLPQPTPYRNEVLENTLNAEIAGNAGALLVSAIPASPAFKMSFGG